MSTSNFKLFEAEQVVTTSESNKKASEFLANDKDIINLFNGISGIYKYTNLDNGAMYIGQAVDLAKRLSQHLQDHSRLRSPEYFSPLHCAMRVHGAGKFKIEILEQKERFNATDAWLDDKERFWIAHFDTYKLRKHYNLTEGGQDGLTQLAKDAAKFPIFHSDPSTAEKAHIKLNEFRQMLLNGYTNELPSLLAICAEWCKKNPDYQLTARGTGNNINQGLGMYKISEEDMKLLNVQSIPLLADETNTTKLATRYATYRHAPYVLEVQVEGDEKSEIFTEMTAVAKYLKLRGVNASSDDLVKEKHYINGTFKYKDRFSGKIVTIGKLNLDLTLVDFAQAVKHETDLLVSTKPAEISTYFVIREDQEGKKTYYDNSSLAAAEAVEPENKILFDKVRKGIYNNLVKGTAEVYPKEGNINGYKFYAKKVNITLPITEKPITDKQRLELKLAAADIKD